MRLQIIALAALALVASQAFAHVTVWPRESSRGAFEKYTVRVPTEGQVATTSIELILPKGFAFVSIGVAAGQTYALKKTDAVVTQITWSMKINPGEFAEFSFMGRNPKEGKELVWKAVQRFEDGSSAEWTGPVGDNRPASVTKLRSN